jgi:DNA-binding phage protein
MLLCWSYSPDDRPTFRYCLEVLKALQLRTSDSIQITSQFPSKTGRFHFPHVSLTHTRVHFVVVSFFTFTNHKIQPPFLTNHTSCKTLTITTQDLKVKFDQCVMWRHLNGFFLCSIFHRNFQIPADQQQRFDHPNIGDQPHSAFNTSTSVTVVDDTQVSRTGLRRELGQQCWPATATTIHTTSHHKRL